MEEKDYKAENEQLQKELEELRGNYNKLFREKCDTDGVNRELKTMNDRLLKIIENLSEGFSGQ